MIENWKYIKNTDKLYKISDMGRIELTKDIIVNPLFKDKFVRKAGIVELYKNIGGYNYYCLTGAKRIHYKKRTVTAYRLVAEHFHLNTKNKPCVNHINGIKTDNRAVNLEWCTHEENSRHAVRLGLCKPGGNGKRVSLYAKLKNHN